MSKKKSYKALMESIESLTSQLENEQADIETSLKLFRDGQILVKEAKARLQQLEHEFVIISAEEINTKPEIIEK
jgi:exodeoxyribonuclease VII small subunit